MLCYHTLGHSYIMLYYTKEGDSEGLLTPKDIPLFEYKQQDLENRTQQFSTKMQGVWGE